MVKKKEYFIKLDFIKMEQNIMMKDMII